MNLMKNSFTALLLKDAALLNINIYPSMFIKFKHNILIYYNLTINLISKKKINQSI